MKIHDYTYNSGNHTIHESDNIGTPEVLMAVNSVFVKESGDIFDDKLQQYKWFECEGISILTTYTVVNMGELCPVWMSFAYYDNAGADTASAYTRKLADTPCKINGNLAAPGLITVILPSAILAGKETIIMLADFAKCVAAIWIEGKLL